MSDQTESMGKPSQRMVNACEDHPLGADRRKMRRLIAEDPEWSLALVPPLTQLCLRHIVKNFEQKPILDELLPSHRAQVLEKLPPELPLVVTANLIWDEGYWRRCCEHRWGVANVSAYGHSWKRMYFEKHLERIIESFVPDITDLRSVLTAIPLCCGYVRKLSVSQLLPPIRQQQEAEEDNGSDTASDPGLNGPSVDHFDFGVLLDKLPQLEELHVAYGVRGCGMNFNWSLFEFTFRDCRALASALRSCKSLKVFRIHQSKVDDEKCRILVHSLLDHPSLRELNLSHNLIGDRGVRAVAKLLNRSGLERLVMCNNRMRGMGGQALAHALLTNTTLTHLDLRLNELGDDGGQALAQALLQNQRLERLHVGSNEMTEPTAMALSQAFAWNHTLKAVNLTCNRLGLDGGKALVEGLSHNNTLLECDTRLTEVGQDSEYHIGQIVQKNLSRARKKSHQSAVAE